MSDSKLQRARARVDVYRGNSLFSYVNKKGSDYLSYRGDGPITRSWGDYQAEIQAKPLGDGFDLSLIKTDQRTAESKVTNIELFRRAGAFPASLVATVQYVESIYETSTEPEVIYELGQTGFRTISRVRACAEKAFLVFAMADTEAFRSNSQLASTRFNID